ncbi:MAG: hypothetical protein WCL16_11895 [bacterium]
MFFCAILPGLAAASEADDRMLATFFEKRAACSNDYAAVIAICNKVTNSMPDSLYLPVIRGVQAWHELAAGKTNQAVATLQSMLSGGVDPIALSANTMACRWLTRLDREKVRQALTAYYAAHVAFPVSLEFMQKLPENRRPAIVDRWNQAWQYRLVTFERLPGLSDQRYELQSRELQAASDYKKILAIPYGTPFSIIPTRVISRFEKQSVVEFQCLGTPPRKDMLSEGAHSGDLFFVRLAGQFTLLSNGDRWELVALPTSRSGAGLP